MSVGARLLRDTMSGFATGVAVVTTKSGPEMHGMTVNSLTSVSLDPPLVLVCLARGSRTAAAIAQRKAFVVNLLAYDQQELSDRFARRGADHFADALARLDEHDLPVLAGGLGYMVCTVEQTLPGGDHEIVLGGVVSCSTREADPLLFFRGRYHRITAPGRPAPIAWYW